MKKAVRIVFAVLLAAGIAAYAIYSSTKPLAVRLVACAAGEARVEFTETGSVVGGVDLNVLSEVAGAVLAVRAKEGAPIRKGEVILSVSPQRYESALALSRASIASIEANIESAVQEGELTKEGYRDSIAELTAKLGTLDAQRRSAASGLSGSTALEDQIAVLEVGVEQARLQRDFAQQRLGDVQALFDQGAAPEADVREAERSLSAAEAGLRQAEESLEAQRKTASSAKSDTAEARGTSDQYYDSLVAEVRAQIDTLSKKLDKDYTGPTVAYYQTLIDAENEKIKDVERSIQKCEVLSPADGVVVELPALEASQVAEGACVAVVKLDGAGALSVETYVSTRDIASVHAGDGVTVVWEGRDGDFEYAGAVSEIRGWAEARLSALGIEEKMVRVVVDVAEGAKEEGLKPGYDVKVRFTAYRAEGKILVPNAAVFEAGGAHYVFVAVDGKAARRAVETGQKTNAQTVVESGLAEGELVVADANTEGLDEGVSITPAQ